MKIGQLIITRFKSHFAQKSGGLLSLGLGGVVLASLAISSCARQDQDLRGSKQISFEFVKEPSEETQQTRSAALENGAESSTTYDVIDMQGGDTPFYLHVEEQDGFPEELEREAEELVAAQRMGLRAASVTTANMHPSIGVFAYQGNPSPKMTAAPNLMNNVEVSQRSGWTTSYRWPGTGYKLHFFAYAPYGAEGLTISAETGYPRPTLEYTVPAEATHQRDLIRAFVLNIPGDSNGPVPLSFKHLCTAVRFVTSDKLLTGKITEVSLKRVYSKGWHKLVGAGVGWEDVSTPADFTQTLDFTVDGTADREVVGDTTTFMMIPQICPQDAYIEVKYQLYGKTVTLTAPLKDKTWAAGKTITYRISPSSILTETKWNVDFGGLVVNPGTDKEYWQKTAQTGGENPWLLKVTSERIIRQRGGSEIQNTQLPWTAEFSTDTVNWSSTAPAWFSNLGSSYQGTTSIDNIQVSAIPGSNMNQTLLNAPEVTTRKDLSRVLGPQNTANCYMVQAAGKYKFPLVYGNGIKNDADNPSAYRYQHEDNNPGVLTPLVANDPFSGIQSPYIYDPRNSAAVKIIGAASLFWQDRPGLITNVKLSADKHEVEFDVPKVPGSLPQQGNAVIGIYNNVGDILWSWHIWVTPLSLDNGLVTITADNTTAQMLRMPIGWVDTSDQYWPQRDLWIRFTQTETGQTKVYRVVQQGDLRLSKQGSSLLYQWGRKDPFPYNFSSADYTGSTGGARLRVDNRNASPALTVQNPMTYYIQDIDWDGTDTFHKWNNDLTYGWAYAYGDKGAHVLATTEMGVKTVYDPSPVGLKVPPGGIYKKFRDHLFGMGAYTGYITGHTGVPAGKGFGANFWACDGYWRWVGNPQAGDYIGVSFAYTGRGADNPPTKLSNPCMGYGVWPVKE